MQIIRNFEIKRSGAAMTITGIDEKTGKTFQRTGFYLVSLIILDGKSERGLPLQALVGHHKESSKTVRLGGVTDAFA